eukprot:scaffold34685_cov183-Amphora_coffeaeformis.AAC.36
MVRMTTKPTRRRRKNVDIESASVSKTETPPSSSSSSNNPPGGMRCFPKTRLSQCYSGCTFLAIIFCIYLGIGFLLLPDPVQRKAYWEPLTSFLSGVLSLVGFTVNVVKDGVIDGRTEKWSQAIDTLVLFLQESGLEVEWTETLQSNLLFADLVVLTDIQEQYPSRYALELSGRSVEPWELQLGQKYMRYATAVYGREMIASAELRTHGHVLIYPRDTDAEVIRVHTQLDNGEVWFSDLTAGENPNHESLRTIVVCDHSTKTVIVSIRGTFSLSGIIVDLAGFCQEFCGGWAHAGFAAAARHTWETIWETVLHHKMNELPPDYNLVLTGHSMGAGVACLITILLHHERPPALLNRTIQCHAFAAPPVFGPLSAAPEAVANIIAYTNGWDCVPSLSVDAIRRFMHTLSRIDAVLQKHPVWQRAAERYELGEPAEDLVQAYHETVTLRPLVQAPMLFVPAESLIWLERIERVGGARPAGFQARVLDPLLYADRIMDVHIPDMMTDHLIPEYESAFEQILSSSHSVTLPKSDKDGPALLRGGQSILITFQKLCDDFYCFRQYTNRLVTPVEPFESILERVVYVDSSFPARVRLHGEVSVETNRCPDA